MTKKILFVDDEKNVLEAIRRQLWKKFDFDLPLDLRGTPFQLQVWELLQEIPWGETRTYGRIAEALGRPKAARPMRLTIAWRMKT